nr:ABC transporter ATP-binding protein [Puniceicoccus vermicola]
MTSDLILQTQNLAFGHDLGTKHERKLGGPLNLTLSRGELVCLLGPNGAGKSTLLRSLCGFLPPISGSVSIAGRDLSDYSPRELARVRGVLPTRESSPEGMTAGELVSLGRHPHSNWAGKLTPNDQAAIDSAFRDTASQQFRDRPIGELSDGERQRVSIARLLAQEPALAFLDEPAAFLDLPSRIEILGKLAAIARTRKIAILLTTHDLESALRHADRIWLLSADGKWTGGAPEDLVLEGAFAKTFPSPALEFDISQGNFRPKTRSGPPVHLAGPDPHRLWTERALERYGWTATTTSGPTIQIEVTTDSQPTQWRLSPPDRPTQTLYSIEDCLQTLGFAPTEGT